MDNSEKIKEFGKNNQDMLETVNNTLKSFTLTQKVDIISNMIGDLFDSHDIKWSFVLFETEEDTVKIDGTTNIENKLELIDLSQLYLLNLKEEVFSGNKVEENEKM